VFLKKCDFSEEQYSSLKMVLGSKHVGAILNVLIYTVLCMCISWCANWRVSPLQIKMNSSVTDDTPSVHQRSFWRDYMYSSIITWRTTFGILP